MMLPSFTPLTGEREDWDMKRSCAGIVTVASMILLAGASYVLANEPAGGGAPDYSGISTLYYVLIGIILAYGVYDSFFKKL
jgi:hypothetical protein